ncbi:MAG: TMEM175 family protein, partial [OM182 bacterium]|nr:TMEM175 family protein [OM182 bacterium]
MNRLSDEYISACRVDRGKILRGENMSRIETFVDAAFAFAFTMLVISIDQIPTNPEELLELSRDIPAFLISAIIIGSIWVTHANWSRHFGLQDSATLYLSLALVML